MGAAYCGEAFAAREPLGDVVVVEDSLGVVVGPEGLAGEGLAAECAAEAGDGAEGPGGVAAPGDEV